MADPDKICTADEIDVCIVLWDDKAEIQFDHGNEMIDVLEVGPRACDEVERMMDSDEWELVDEDER